MKQVSVVKLCYHQHVRFGTCREPTEHPRWAHGTGRVALGARQPRRRVLEDRRSHGPWMKDACQLPGTLSI